MNRSCMVNIARAGDSPEPGKAAGNRFYYGMIKTLFLLVLSTTSGLCHAGAADESFEDHFRLLCESTIQFDEAIDLHAAFARFALNQDLDEANRRLENAYLSFFDGSESGNSRSQSEESTEMTPELADSKVKWQMRTWLRIYYLYGDGLTEENTIRLESLFWNYACRKSTIARAQLKYIWCIQGSENHDMMDLSNAFLCIQAIKDNPDYRDRELPDGHTLSEHYEAWNRYYKEYCLTRARNGLYAEVNSPTYGKYFIPELTNMADFAEDPDLQERMVKLLDLTWADWAVDQLGCIRGGGKTRSYLNHYSFRGISDSWYHMGRIILDQEDWWDGTKISNHAIHGFPYIMGSSKYRLPKVIRELALNPEERGDYEYVSLRPGKEIDNPVVSDDLPKGTYQMDGNDPHLVRYSYCTPDYIMGSFMDDPSLGNYAGISTQNRWQGIIFATDENARIFPQCEGTRYERNYSQFQSVQYKNVMLVRRNPQGHEVGDMRLCFSKGMKDRLTRFEHRWLIQEGDAFVAVIPMAATEPLRAAGTQWDDDCWLRIEEEPSVVIFITGRKRHHKEMESFLDDILSHRIAFDGRNFTYEFTDIEGNLTILSLPTDGPGIPQIDGQPVDLNPEQTFRSPYFHSGGRSGMATVQFRDEKLSISMPNYSP